LRGSRVDVRPSRAAQFSRDFWVKKPMTAEEKKKAEELEKKRKERQEKRVAARIVR
jgi:hypothetical protein